MAVKTVIKAWLKARKKKDQNNFKISLRVTKNGLLLHSLLAVEDSVKNLLEKNQKKFLLETKKILSLQSLLRRENRRRGKGKKDIELKSSLN